MRQMVEIVEAPSRSLSVRAILPPADDTLLLDELKLSQLLYAPAVLLEIAVSVVSIALFASPMRRRESSNWLKLIIRFSPK